VRVILAQKCLHWCYNYKERSDLLALPETTTRWERNNYAETFEATIALTTEPSARRDVDR
jgi:hypothetical protein